MKNYQNITPEGTRDLLFEECEARRNIESALSRLFKSRGYRKVITPTFEFYDVFNRKSSGLLAEELYSLTDNSGRLLVLRPDSTLPIARIATTRLKEKKLPIRLYYNHHVFRRCPSFSGHSDETSQGGIELIGAAGLRADLEVLMTAYDALISCGAPDFKIEIGHAVLFSALLHEISADEATEERIGELIETKNFTALDELMNEIGQCDATKALQSLPKLFGGKEVLDKARTLCKSKEALEAIEYLQTVYDCVCEMGLSENINIDLGLVHRLGYYTGIVFRGYIEGSGITVLTGGRYDSLMGEFGKEMPATGFGVETDALARAMLARGDIAGMCHADILVFAASGSEAKALLELKRMNSEGYICEFSPEQNINDAIEYAKRQSIPEIYIIDGNEIKKMQTKCQGGK